MKKWSDEWLMEQSMNLGLVVLYRMDFSEVEKQCRLIKRNVLSVVKNATAKNRVAYVTIAIHLKETGN